MVYVDFTTCDNTKDEDGDYTITANRIIVDTMRRDADSYNTKDYGANHFTQTYTHSFKFIYVGWATDNYCVIVLCGVGNSPTGTLEDLITANDGIVCNIQRTVTGLRFTVADFNVDNSDNTYTYVGGTPATFYIDVIRDNSPKATVNIYSDEAKTILLDSLFIVCQVNLLQYLYCANSREDALSHATAQLSGELLNLDLNEAPTTSDKNIPNYFNSKYITHH